MVALGAKKQFSPKRGEMSFTGIISAMLMIYIRQIRNTFRLFLVNLPYETI
jgi:hypothetical protein